jgi:hypothetical protein
LRSLPADCFAFASIDRASLLHCNKTLRAQYQSNVPDPIGSGFIASRRDAEEFSPRFCFPVARQLSEGSVITRRRNVRRNPAEDVIELSDRPLEILIAGKHECVPRQPGLKGLANRSLWSTSVFWIRGTATRAAERDHDADLRFPLSSVLFCTWTRITTLGFLARAFAHSHSIIWAFSNSVRRRCMNVLADSG